MPRKLRTLLRGYPHHIVQRGHDRNPVFNNDRDYLYYLANLNELRAKFDVCVYGFCLMTNHVHLLVEPINAGESLSKLMKTLAGRQTRRVNRLKGRSGTLWEGRFKCSIVDNTAYLLACMRYIDLNPVRAGMVAHPADYPWSSYRLVAGYEPNAWITLHPALHVSGNTEAARRKAYEDYVADGCNEAEIELIRSAVNRNQLTGDERFRTKISRRIGRKMESRGPGRPRK